MVATKQTAENQGFSYNAEEFGLDPVEKAYRDALGDGLEAALAEAQELADIVNGLNDRHVAGPAGERWTEELLVAEFNRLAR